MIINISRSKGWQRCRRYEYNLNELKLLPLQEADNLMTGDAVHQGIATLLATRDTQKAVGLAETVYRDRLKDQMLLPEEQAIVENQITYARAAVAAYAKQLPGEGFEVLMPEVSFAVKLPNTEHHCWFCHRLLYPKTGYEMCRSAECDQPHILRGRSDALVKWQGMLWLLEHKTSAINTTNYWSGWMLDVQLTGYIYGIWKATGLKPAGAILNMISKPRKNAKNFEDVTFQREPFLRSDEDLQRFEDEIIRIADDYETGMRDGDIYMNTQSCFNWNRECYFHSMCVNHNQYSPEQFRIRPMDYVEEEYYKLLGKEIPNAADK